MHDVGNYQEGAQVGAKSEAAGNPMFRLQFEIKQPLEIEKAHGIYS